MQTSAKILGLLSVFVLAVSAGYSQNKISNSNNKKLMEKKITYSSVYPTYATKKIDETKKFYEEVLGFETLFHTSWFLVMRSAGQPAFDLAFIHEYWPEAPKPPRIIANGNAGAYLTLEVANVDEVYQIITNKGIKPFYPLQDEPWGQRRFVIQDPSGIYIDIVMTIEPQQNYWNPYLKK